MTTLQDLYARLDELAKELQDVSDRLGELLPAHDSPLLTGESVKFAPQSDEADRLLERQESIMAEMRLLHQKIADECKKRRQRL